jgi:hypothetical protein
MKIIKEKIIKIKEFLFSDVLISPCQGDVVEMSDGERRFVVFFDGCKIFYPESLGKFPNAKGRRKETVVVGSSEWPIEGALLYRGDKLLFPQKNYKLNILVWLSNKLLK